VKHQGHGWWCGRRFALFFAGEWFAGNERAARNLALSVSRPMAQWKARKFALAYSTRRFFATYHHGRLVRRGEFEHDLVAIGGLVRCQYRAWRSRLGGVGAGRYGC